MFSVEVQTKKLQEYVYDFEDYFKGTLGLDKIRNLHKNSLIALTRTDNDFDSRSYCKIIHLSEEQANSIGDLFYHKNTIGLVVDKMWLQDCMIMLLETKINDIGQIYAYSVKIEVDYDKFYKKWKQEGFRTDLTTNVFTRFIKRYFK